MDCQALIVTYNFFFSLILTKNTRQATAQGVGISSATIPWYSKNKNNNLGRQIGTWLMILFHDVCFGGGSGGVCLVL